MKPPFIRSPYNYDTNKASDESGLACPEPSLTQQSFVEESDINFIAERYGLTGELPQVLQLPRYGDFTGIFDFQSAQNAVRKSLEQFMSLPAKIRSRFDNNPQKLLSFLEDPENREEAQFLGLVEKPPLDVTQSAKGDEPPGVIAKGSPAPEQPPEPPKSKKDKN